MANADHLTILKQGRESWNHWREEQPRIKPDLSQVDFTRASDFKSSEIWGRHLMANDDEADRLLLHGFNFSQTDFYKADLSGVDLTDADLSDTKLVHTRLSGARMKRAILNGAQLWGAILAGADLSKVKLARTHLVDIDFSETCLDDVNFSSLNLCGARFVNASLRNADFRNANLANAHFKRADLRHADLTGATLTNSLWIEANVADIKYNRELLQGRCGSIGGVAEMYGMPLFRRDLMDQDYLDSLLNKLQAQQPRAEWLWGYESNQGIKRPGWFRIIDIIMAVLGAYPREFKSPLKPLPLPAPLRKKAATIADEPDQPTVLKISPVLKDSRPLMKVLWVGRHRLVGGLMKSSAIFGALFGMLLPVITSGVWAVQPALFYGLFIGYFLGVFFSSWAFHRLSYWLWQWVDFGRDWQGVFFIGIVAISLMGGGYKVMEGTHVHLDYPLELLMPEVSENTDPVTVQGLKHWFYPWFVAAMGFATLGIADLAKPLTGLGMLLMIANVLAGFFTLGLLLSVLANIFARRS